MNHGAASRSSDVPGSINHHHHHHHHWSHQPESGTSSSLLHLHPSSQQQQLRAAVKVNNVLRSMAHREESCGNGENVDGGGEDGDGDDDDDSHAGEVDVVADDEEDNDNDRADGCSGQQSVHAELDVTMRKKKQRIIVVGGAGNPSSSVVDGGAELDRERPMSWEGELSDEDFLSKGMEEMSPSPLPGRITCADPGSPMSTNDSDKEDAPLQASSRRTMQMVNDFASSSTSVIASVAVAAVTTTMTATTMAIGKPFIRHHRSPHPNGPCSTNSVVVGLSTLQPDNSKSPLDRHCSTNGPPPPPLNFYSPTQSPLQPRHTNSHQSYSSSSSPEQIKRLFYSPNQSPIQTRHIPTSLVEPPFSQSPSPSQSRHPIAAAAKVQEHVVVFSPSQSPVQSRHGGVPGGQNSPYSSPYSSVGSPSGSIRYSPNESPIQERHALNSFSVVVSSSAVTTVEPQLPSTVFPPSHIPPATHCSSRETLLAECGDSSSINGVQDLSCSAAAAGDCVALDDKSGLSAELVQHAALAGQAGISRQQLINSPCPICGDRISGFHYGIFSCESCKGFFKRTVQNKKNYVCLRGAGCPITTTTRKKCPACRFDKCLKRGMKLEAIREDRTRGGRSTYQCTYALPPSLTGGGGMDGSSGGLAGFSPSGLMDQLHCGGGDRSGDESDAGGGLVNGSGAESTSSKTSSSCSTDCVVPNLITEIMSVEHLWYYSEGESGSAPTTTAAAAAGGTGATTTTTTNKSSSSSEHNDHHTHHHHHHHHSSVQQPKGLFDPATAGSDFFGNLCNIADHRLYKIVKWCKSLPLFRNVSIDDQICLLLNSWCQLLLLSCCYRSIPTPEEIRVSFGKSVSLVQARSLGLGPVIERMLNLTEHLRRLRVDQYEYVCLKVIILLTSDVVGLKEPEKVRHAQERVIQALQTYTMSRYGDHPSKFGELLLRIPELERTCQIGKDSLSMKQREGEVPGFNLLVELLRGEH